MKKLILVMVVSAVAMVFTALADGQAAGCCPKAKGCPMMPGCPASTNAPACTNAPAAAQPAQ